MIPNSPNLSPVEPLQQAQKQPRTRKVSLLEYLKERRDRMRQEKQSEAWQNRLSASQRNELYYQGFQRLRRADLSYNWRPLEPKPIHYILNEFQFWVNVNVYKWNSSRVDYRVSGMGEQNEDAEAVARKVEWIATYYDDRDWTRTEVIRAAKEAQFTGYLVAYTYYDKNYLPRQVFLPVTERLEEKMGEDVYRCADCGMVGTQSPCLCGSNRQAVTESPMISGEVATGTKAIQQGDVRHRLISLYNIVWKARLGLKDSNTVLWEEEYDTEELEACWPDLEIASSNSDDPGIKAISNIESGGKGKSGKNKTSVLSRMWLEPSAYKGVELKEGFATVTGLELSAGTLLEQVFPKGCHAIMIDDQIVDLYEAVKNDDLCAMEYNAVPRGLAQGVDAMCEPQRQRNTMTSLVNVALRHNACPPSTFIKGLINPGDMSGDPTKPVPIEAQNLALYPGVSPSQAWEIKQGQQIPNAVFTYAEGLRAAIQFAAHATEFSEGLPNVNNDTLGGARIAQGLAQGVYGTYLAQFADFRVEIIKRKLKKFQQHCWDKRYIQFAGDLGVFEGEMLSGMDIPDEFQITPVPNSWLPRTPEQRQQNMQALLAAIGGPAGLAGAPPGLLAELCEIYDVRYTENLYPTAIRTARILIRQAEKMLPALKLVQGLTEAATGMPMMEEGVDPMTGQAVIAPANPGIQLFNAITPKFNPRWAGVAEIAEYLSRYLITDAGLQAPPEIIEFIGVLQDAAIEAAGMQNMVRNSVATAGQLLPMGATSGELPAPNPAAANVAVGG